MLLRREELIATGGYAKVYVGRVYKSDPGTPEVVAVKKCHTGKTVVHPLGRHEACALLAIQGHQAIPKIYAYGRSECFEYIILDRLGPTVDTLPRKHDLSLPRRKFNHYTMRNLVALICQMINAIRHVHLHHLVHCDIKPGNFLFDSEPSSGLIKLVGLGLARRYRDPVTRVHVPEGALLHGYGSPCYNSLNIHMHTTPSRRDDMESLAYTIADLVRKGLPWDKLESEDVFARKQSWSGPDICAGYPAVFGAFIDHTRSLDFQAEPDYEGWRSRFLALAPEVSEHPSYDPSDSGPRIPKCRVKVAPPNMDRARLRKPPASRDPASPPLQLQLGEGWIHPAGSRWVHTSSIPEEDLYGDEQRMVRENLQSIEQPPDSDIWGEDMYMN